MSVSRDIGTGHFTLSATDDPRRFTWTPSHLLLTPATTLQGGAGLGAALVAIEAVAGRPVIWATAQYLSYAAGSEPIDLDVTIEVAGHNTTQARCMVSRSGDEILTAHAALGQRQSTFDGVWKAPPPGSTPQQCDRYRFFERGMGDLGDLIELRLMRGRQLDEISTGAARGDGIFALWVRCWEGPQMVSVADLALIGDLMPLGFADALGAQYAGNSLDNTIRVGHLVATEWILLYVHITQIANGFGYGHAELWAEDNTLLGQVSQTAVLREHRQIRATGRP